MRHLDDRKSTMMAGLFLCSLYPVRLPAYHPGWPYPEQQRHRLRHGLLYRYTNGGLTVTPGIGVQWKSENQNEYYYGVSRKESAPRVCVAITRTTAGALTWKPAPATTSSATGSVHCIRALYPSV
ncbi:MipA/OmpV family protein [Escherichia coli]